MSSGDVEAEGAPTDGESRFGADAPTADIPDEDVVEFIRELNESLGARITGSAKGVTTTPVIRNDAPYRRDAVDPANPPSTLTHSRLRVIDVYERCVEAEKFTAAAALRRRDSFDVQNDLSNKIPEFVFSEEKR